jgi:DNA-binding beta-propeller fold protein YncE
VAHPQIAAFARMAKENVVPSRVIAGQTTKLGRTMHAIHYDAIHDEVVVSNPFAQAILSFRADAKGEQPPVRVLQGPSTGLDSPDRFSIDPVHNEFYVGQGHEILIFSRTANGDAAPIRRMTGEWTARETAIDPIHNVIVATGSPDDRRSRNGGGAILFFDRTANGDVKPKSFIRGAHTGLEGSRQIQVYPDKGLVYVSQTLDDDEIKPGSYFVGVWSINDSGDAPPRWKIGGAKSELKRARGVAIDPAHKEVIVADMLRNAVLTFYFPEVF